MRKIKYCFIHLKRLLNEAKPCENALLASDIPEDKVANSSFGTEELKKLKNLLQQRDNEINILVNMLKKEKKKAQNALLQLSASSGTQVSALSNIYKFRIVTLYPLMCPI
ncbi:UNVERIFIED_CONTAM: hypothetical protein K2H54_056030 [Gekko kuhli]